MLYSSIERENTKTDQKKLSNNVTNTVHKNENKKNTGNKDA